MNISASSGLLLLLLFDSSFALAPSQPRVDVLFEDHRVVVVDKPPGVAVHADADAPGLLQLLRASRSGRSGSDSGGVVAVAEKAEEEEEQEDRLHLCHRLDRGTSGILVLAKVRLRDSPEAGVRVRFSCFSAM